MKLKHYIRISLVAFGLLCYGLLLSVGVLPVAANELNTGVEAVVYNSDVTDNLNQPVPVHDNIEITQTPSDSTPVEQEEPVLEEPATRVEQEEPALEELSTPVEQEEPVVEESTTPVEQEETVAEEPTVPVEQEEPVVEEPATPVEQEEPVVEEPATPVEQEEPVVEEPATPVEQEETVAEEPATPVEQEETVAEESTTPVEQEEPVAEEPTIPVEQEEKIAAEQVIPRPQKVDKLNTTGLKTGKQANDRLKPADSNKTEIKEQKRPEKKQVRKVFSEGLNKIKKSVNKRVSSFNDKLNKIGQVTPDLNNQSTLQTKEKETPFISYRVRLGESLWLIGKTLGVQWEKIKGFNNLVSTIIYPDQELAIPDVDIQDDSTIQYKIKRKDSLYWIGQSLGFNYKELMELNDLEDHWIYPDQTLRVPVSVQKEVNTFSKVNSKRQANFFEANGVRNDLDLLARAVFAEARGESFNGQVAVASVILNRLAHPLFPNSIQDIVFQPWAFTAVNDGQINLKPNRTAYRAAMEALNGYDPTGGAIFYWNPEKAESRWVWTRTVITTIGNHVFAK